MNEKDRPNEGDGREEREKKFLAASIVVQTAHAIKDNLQVIRETLCKLSQISNKRQ